MEKLVKRTILRIGYPLALVYWYFVKPKTERAKIILSHQGKILLVKQTFHYKQWTLAGGGINYNEPPVAAAARELEEELGLSGINLEFVGLIDNRVDNRQDFIYVFAGELTSDQVAAINPDGVEIGAAQWFTLDNLPYLKPNNQAIIKLYDGFQNS